MAMFNSYVFVYQRVTGSSQKNSDEMIKLSLKYPKHFITGGLAKSWNNLILFSYMSYCWLHFRVLMIYPILHSMHLDHGSTHPNSSWLDIP
jgi:hypothetical protein